MEKQNKLGQNIRGLRRFYGETQETLGTSVGVEKTTISNYEKGTRAPDYDMLKRLAEHYETTPELLMSDDFSILAQKRFIAYNNNISCFDLFPLLSSDVALTNVHFLNAYNLHKTLWEKIDKHIALQKSDFDDIDTIWDEYYGAINYDGDMVDICSCANFLSIVFCLAYTFDFILVGTTISDGGEPGTAVLNNVMRSISKNFDIYDLIEHSNFEENAFPIDVLSQYYDDDIFDDVLDCLSTLKESNHRDLSDYYLAMMHFCGLQKSDLSLITERHIGYSMLHSFSLLGNKYAKKTLNRFLAFLTE